MLKALLKKQMLEFFWGFSIKGMNKKASAKSSVAGAALILVLVVFSLMLMFFSVAYMMSPVIVNGYTEVYFAIFGILSSLMGIFGSVFLTYNTVYEAKDNDMLFSMPIPPSMILFSRMAGLYLTALGFEVLVFIPAIVVYFITAEFSFFTLILSSVSVIILPLLSLSVSCVLGWVIALFSSKIKNKSIITVVFSIAFFAVYYFAAMRLNAIINMIIYNAEKVGEMIRRYLYIFYQFGKGLEGELLSYLAFFFITVAVFSLIYKVLSRTFIKFATANRGMKKAVYKEKKSKQISSKAALLKKEFLFFKNTPAYILNSALGSVLLVIFSVLIAVKQEEILPLTEMTGLAQDDIPVFMGLALCFIASTNNLTSSSVSLESKSLWLIRSVPVDVKDILFAKMMLHITVTGIPLVVGNIILAVSMKNDLLSAVLLTVFSLLFMTVCAGAGLIANLIFPKMEWTNETVPIKQSLSSFLSMVVGFILTVISIASYVVSLSFLSSSAFMTVGTVLLLILVLTEYRWIVTSGIKRFSAL